MQEGSHTRATCFARRCRHSILCFRAAACNFVASVRYVTLPLMGPSSTGMSPPSPKCWNLTLKRIEPGPAMAGTAALEESVWQTEHSYVSTFMNGVSV